MTRPTDLFIDKDDLFVGTDGDDWGSPSNTITAYGTRVVVDGVTEDVDKYYYLPYTVNSHAKFELSFFSEEVLTGRCSIWMVSNRLDDTKGLIDASDNCIFLEVYKDSLSLKENSSSGLVSDSYTISSGTKYYLRVRRAHSTITCSIYSDIDRTVLLDTLSIASNMPAESYKYLFIFNSYNSGVAGSGWYGEIADLYAVQLSKLSSIRDIISELQTQLYISSNAKRVAGISSSVVGDLSIDDTVLRKLANASSLIGASLSLESSIYILKNMVCTLLPYLTINALSLYTGTVQLLGSLISSSLEISSNVNKVNGLGSELLPNLNISNSVISSIYSLTSTIDEELHIDNSVLSEILSITSTVDSGLVLESVFSKFLGISSTIDSSATLESYLSKLISLTSELILSLFITSNLSLLGGVYRELASDISTSLSVETNLSNLVSLATNLVVSLYISGDLEEATAIEILKLISDITLLVKKNSTITPLITKRSPLDG